ncbi:MAG TPA: hypothetical protein VHO07_07010, partial [Streptosporangiaceae bacterium]|nr:hypothetical protein [Streptosporangiaceae bacterium]
SHARPWNPDWATHKVAEAADTARVKFDIKGGRHYTASQLLAGGFDLRNTAARLGHSGGGATTLRHYADPVPEVDRRAAAYLAQLTARPAPSSLLTPGPAQGSPLIIPAARHRDHRRVRHGPGYAVTVAISWMRRADAGRDSADARSCSNASVWLMTSCWLVRQIPPGRPGKYTTPRPGTAKRRIVAGPLDGGT